MHSVYATLNIMIDFSKSRTNRAGFTIVELLVVIVVIGILSAIVIVAYNGVTIQARNTAIQSDVRNAQSKLMADNATTGSYPTSAAAADNGAGLQVSPGNTLQYVYNYKGQAGSYCLAVSSLTGGAKKYIASNIDGSKEGVCSQASVSKGTPGPSCGANCFYLVLTTQDFVPGSYTVQCMFGFSAGTPTSRSLVANGSQQLSCYNFSVGVEAYVIISGWGQSTSIIW